VYHSGAQHQHDLVEQRGMVLECQRFAQLDVVQPRRGVARGIGHQLHQQHALETDMRLRHAHAGSRQAIQRIHLGVLPRLLRILRP